MASGDAAPIADWQECTICVRTCRRPNKNTECKSNMMNKNIVSWRGLGSGGRWLAD